MSLKSAYYVIQTSKWSSKIDNETNIAELVNFGETLGLPRLENIDDRYDQTVKEI